jgi:sugar phosphate isomerase/epimerase
MRLGVSNLAWESDIDPKLLLQNDISYVEIVLPKYVAWGSSDLSALRNTIQRLSNEGIQVESTQAILYGSGVTSFDSTGFVDHIKEVSSICQEVGIRKIVLGAPTCRLGDSSSVGFLNNFHYIDRVLQQRNQQLLIEPNSRVYGGSYFFTVGEVVEFIDMNGFSNISTMIDTHNVILENEIPYASYIENIDMVKHIHVSEVGLTDYKHSNIHSDLANALKVSNYEGLLIYEAKPSANLAESLTLFKKTYKL